MNPRKPKFKNSRGGTMSAVLVAAIIWAVLTSIVFVGMRNYPELPGQKVPKPWMISVFLAFLATAGLWTHVYFGFLHQRIRVVVANKFGMKSRAGSLTNVNILSGTGPDDWEAAPGTAIHKLIIFTAIEWMAIVVGIMIPIALLLTSGAILTAYLSEQVSGREIAAWFGW